MSYPHTWLKAQFMAMRSISINLLLRLLDSTFSSREIARCLFFTCCVMSTCNVAKRDERLFVNPSLLQADLANSQWLADKRALLSLQLYAFVANVVDTATKAICWNENKVFAD